LFNNSVKNVRVFKRRKWRPRVLAAYKCPRHIVFAEIPKTTGKLQKFKLRAMVPRRSPGSNSAR
jgi:acyl-coenzyme A synthetase/AMP-(fatty) acid ligase